MSSPVFSTELTPEPGLRRVVLVSGVVMLVLGLVIVAAMSATVTVRVLIATAWLLLAYRQLLALVRHHALVHRIRVYADGSAEIAAADGAWRPATLSPGSVVLERLAWLRLDTGFVPQAGELLAGNARKNKDWRRLPMIWRHLGSAA